jgi:hypothetical protein
MPLSNIKVLMLNVNRSGWHSGNMVYDMEVAKQACQTTIYGPGWDNYKHTDISTIIDQVYVEDVPDIIYSYFTSNEKVGDVYINHYKIPENLWYFPCGMDKLTNGKYKNIKRVFVVSDFWARSPAKWKSDMKNSNFQYCFSCFTPPLSKKEDFFAFMSPKIMGNPEYVSLPRCVDKECFKDYGQAKEQDIITVGSMCNFYPLRRHIHYALSNYCDGKNIVYKNYPHCGTDWSHTGFVRDKYAQAINKSLALASCGGRYHLYFNKIFEAWGCNTAYIGEEPVGADYINMKDGFNYVSVAKDNLIEKVQYYMDHKDELKKIAKNGQETFLRYHTLEARAKDFQVAMEHIL